jgi:peptidoglycan hydrolase CwlO-like protein
MSNLKDKASEYESELTRLTEERNDLELKLEQKTKAASEWASKAIEAGNQRAQLSSRIQELERKITELEH